MSENDHPWRLRQFDVDDFLAHYWQQKPLVIRQAIADFELPLSPEELAGLACEPGVHCRLVQEQEDDSPWLLRYGPFNESDFTSLPESHYSLLVSDCEKWIPQLNELVDQFRFLPSWRIDDLMISYAPDQGSVGPHVDEYDVFLLQGMGERRWYYSENRLESPALIADIDLAILAEASFDCEVVLQPGDMLYLPPGVAHHGVAEGPCMTCSIGFRAPSLAEIMESVLQEAEQQNLSSRRYTDGLLDTKRSTAEITSGEIERFREFTRSLLDQPQSFWVDSIGKLLSDSPVAAAPDAVASFSADWIKHPETRCLYFVDGEQIRLFVNGQAHTFPNTTQIREIVEQLCLLHEFHGGTLKSWSKVDELRATIMSLMENGTLLAIDDE